MPLLHRAASHPTLASFLPCPEDLYKGEGSVSLPREMYKTAQLFSWADYRLDCSVFLDGCVLLASVPRQPTPESTVY